MKKIIALLCCFAFLFVLTSCDNDFVNSVVDAVIGHTFYYEYDEISQNVEKAEIINLTADYTYSSAFTIDKIDESDVEILKTLDYEKTLELLQDFCQIEYAEGPFVYNGLPIFDEICIRVWYSDGTGDLYSSSITTLAWGSCGWKDFRDLTNKYLEQ